MNDLYECIVCAYVLGFFELMCEFDKFCYGYLFELFDELFVVFYGMFFYHVVDLK